jgi:hypothetical protein
MLCQPPRAFPFGTTGLVFVSHGSPPQLTAGRARQELVETSLVPTTDLIRAQGDELPMNLDQFSSGAPRPHASIHRSAWKVNSANFALTEFYEVRKRGVLLALAKVSKKRSHTPPLHPIFIGDSLPCASIKTNGVEEEARHKGGKDRGKGIAARSQREHRKESVSMPSFLLCVSSTHPTLRFRSRLGQRKGASPKLRIDVSLKP